MEPLCRDSLCRSCGPLISSGSGPLHQGGPKGLENAVEPPGRTLCARAFGVLHNPDMGFIRIAAMRDLLHYDKLFCVM